MSARKQSSRRCPHFFVCLFQDESHCCWTCDALIVSMICSPHSDKYILGNDRHIAVADHFVFLWVLVWCLAIVQHVSRSLFTWVVTDFWGTKKSLTPEYALWDIPLFFQIEAKFMTCREQLQAKQLRQWLKLMKTLYMVCYAQVDWYIV